MVEFSLTVSLFIALVAALAITLFQYAQFKRKGTIYLWMALFRFLAIFCVALLLLNPKIHNAKVTTEKPSLTLLVDNSSSIADLGYDKIASQLLNELSQDNSLSNSFDIQTLVFDAKLKPKDSLQFNGTQTNIFNALKHLTEPRTTNPRAIVLLTDGNQTIGKDYMYAIDQDSTTRVYPIVMGDSTIALDLNITRLNVNKYVYLNNKFPVEVFVNYQGDESITTDVGIYQGDQLLARKAVQFDANTSTRRLNFEIHAQKIGLQSLSALVQPHPRENNTHNNSKSFAVEVIDQQSNIAILSTVIHPDLGALKKSIVSNQYKSVQLLDPTKDQLNFEDFELVILYQPNSDFKAVIELLEREHRNYWLIGGADTQWEFLNTMELGFLKTTQHQLEEVLPYKNTAFDLFGVGELNFDHMSPLVQQMGTLNFTTTPQVMLYKKVAGIATTEPLLMTFEEQNHKKALLAAEGIWRWRATTYLDTDSFVQFDTYIGSLVQYLSNTKARKRLEIYHEPFYYENTKSVLRADYYDKNYRLQPNGNLNILLSDVNSNQTTTLPLVGKGGSYEVDLGGLAPSTYDYTVRVADQDLREGGRLQILPFEVEKQFVNPNIKKLNQLVNRHNGSLYFSDQIGKLKSELSTSKSYLPVQKVTQNIVPLVHWKWLLALAVLSLTGEWFLRKYNGLI